MGSDYGLGAVTGIIPTILVAGVATNMIEKVGLGAQQKPAPVNATDTCKKCGTVLDADATYCSACGANVKTGKVSKAQLAKMSKGKKVAASTTNKVWSGNSGDLTKVWGGGKTYNPFKG